MDTKEMETMVGEYYQVRKEIEDFEKLRRIEPQLNEQQKAKLQAIYERFHYAELESPAALTSTVLEAKTLLDQFSE